jgi:hypothetical protein
MKRRRASDKQETAVRRSPLGQLGPVNTVLGKTGEVLIDDVAPQECKATGTRSKDVGSRIIYQAASAAVWPKPEAEDDLLATSIALMEEMIPQNATEAMLAVQMIATHEAALMFVRRATLEDQATEAIDLNVCRASRLLRIFLLQLEVVQKLKGKAGQQKVTVEHVHVHPGGQAIVGAVSTSKHP